MAKILVIDDEPGVLAVFNGMLVSGDHEVMLASSGMEGVQLCETGPPDAVICDILMPDQDGIETIMKLRKAYPSIKIIAITGGGQGGHDNYLKAASVLGANATAAKPIDKASLLALVDKVLAS